MQLKILKRALKLVRPGGEVIYSTCSFNPIENEAVVGAAIVGLMVENENENEQVGGVHCDRERVLYWKGNTNINITTQFAVLVIRNCPWAWGGRVECLRRSNELESPKAHDEGEEQSRVGVGE